MSRIRAISVSAATLVFLGSATAATPQQERDAPPLWVDRAAGLALLAPGVSPATWAQLVKFSRAALGPGDSDITWPHGLDANLSYEANVLRTILGTARGATSLPWLGGALAHDKGLTIALGPGAAALRVHDGAVTSLDGPGVTTEIGRRPPESRLRFFDLQPAPGDVVVVYPEDAARTVGRDVIAAASTGGTSGPAADGRLQLWRAASSTSPRIRRGALVHSRGSVVLVHVD